VKIRWSIENREIGPCVSLTGIWAVYNQIKHCKEIDDKINGEKSRLKDSKLVISF
jgi:hypothetical protein